MSLTLTLTRWRVWCVRFLGAVHARHVLAARLQGVVFDAEDEPPGASPASDEEMSCWVHRQLEC